jgi:transcriptional regulator
MAAAKNDLLPGTLELLILRTLAIEPMHGYGIALHIERLSREVLQVEEGSLYPALQRLELKGWVRSEWRLTPTKRRARYYQLTRPGQRQLGAELQSFDRLFTAIRRVLNPAEVA